MPKSCERLNKIGKLKLNIKGISLNLDSPKKRHISSKIKLRKVEKKNVPLLP